MKNRLREIREIKGLTLDQVAKAAGTSIPQIQRLEKGERRLTTDWIERLAMALGVSVGEIVPGLGSSGESEELQRIYKKLRKVSREQHRAFENMLDAFIKSDE